LLVLQGVMKKDVGGIPGQQFGKATKKKTKFSAALETVPKRKTNWSRPQSATSRRKSKEKGGRLKKNMREKKGDKTGKFLPIAPLAG